MPRTPSQSTKAQAILAGALEVFTTHGYAAASMDRIAAAAGVSKPTVYSYFQHKEGLFIALVQDLTESCDRILSNLQNAPELQAPPQQALRHLANAVLEQFMHNRPLLTLMRLIIGESEQFPELAETFVREIQRPLFERLSGYLGSHPQLHFADPEIAARVFAGSIVHYLLVQKVMHGDAVLPLDQHRMVDGLVDLIVAGGAPPSPKNA